MEQLPISYEGRSPASSPQCPDTECPFRESHMQSALNFWSVMEPRIQGEVGTVYSMNVYPYTLGSLHWPCCDLPN